MEDTKKEAEQSDNRMQNIGGKGFVSHAFQQIIRGAPPSENKEQSAQEDKKQKESAKTDEKVLPKEEKKQSIEEIKTSQSQTPLKKETLPEQKQETEIKKETQPEQKPEQKPAQKQEKEIKKETKVLTEKKPQTQTQTQTQTAKTSSLAQELAAELSVETAVQTLYSKILYQVKQQPLSRKELSSALGQKHISGQLNQVILKLLAHSLIEHTIEAVPNHPRQKFKLSNKGAEFLNLVEYKKSQENQ